MLVISGNFENQEEINTGSRCWLLAEALADSHDVILALPFISQLSHENFAVVYYVGRNIPLVARDSDCVVCDAEALVRNPLLLDAGKPLAVDLDGFGVTINDETLDVLTTADFFFCAGEDDRYFWLAALKECGRINEYTLAGDSGLRQLLDVVLIPGQVQPLVDFCAIPRYAPDRGTGLSRADMPRVQKHATGIKYYWHRTRYLLRTEGFFTVCVRGLAVIKRKSWAKNKNR